MKHFTKWCEDNKLELPVVAENTRRTGLGANYPAAYVQGQYPHKYFNPTLANTDLKLQQTVAPYAGQKAAN